MSSFAHSFVRRFCGCLLCMLCTLAITAHAGTPVVITDGAHPVYNLPLGARVIELDTVQQLHEQRFAALPAHPEQAESVVRARLQHSDKTWQQAMQAALQGMVDAWVLGISKIPAVVLEGHVVYGETDVGLAIERIRTYQQERAR